MKKNLKFVEATPVVETKRADTLKVRDVIATLSNFSPDAEIHIDGGVLISDDINDETLKAVANSPKVANVTVDSEPFYGLPESFCESCDCDCDTCDLLCCEGENEETAEDIIMKTHLFGHDEIARAVRGASSDHLIDAPIMNPNKVQLDFENRELHPYQTSMIDEIRVQNACVVESLTELYRRQLAALLEYNTQCMAHLTTRTNAVMCEIVDRK